MNGKIKDKKGFTIMELLIVIAMIVVLVGLYIPTFSGQTEKAREAVDAAAVRSAIAAVSNSYMLGEAVSGVSDDNEDFYYKSVTLQQKKTLWQSNGGNKSLAIGAVNVATTKNGKIAKSWSVRCYKKDYTTSSTTYREGQVSVTTSSS